MFSNNITIKDLRGCWVSYYKKIDGSIFSCGVPQYHTVVKVKGSYNWKILHDNASDEHYNPKLAFEVRDFLNEFSQLEKIPNRYGNYYDSEGSMYISSQLLKIYFDKHKEVK